MKKNNFKYVNFNANPKNKKTEECVIRAISKGLNQKWEDTYLEMAKFCIKYKIDAKIRYHFKRKIFHEIICYGKGIKNIYFRIFNRLFNSIR